MLRATLWLLLACGCYRPDPVDGAPCGAGDTCPSGLTCYDGHCHSSKPWLDAPARDAAVDAATDANIDAAPDAFVDTGCADGTREGFINRATYPAIAGCAATWTGAVSLRAARTGAPCGGATACAAPADACASGWHVCMTDGQPADLVLRIGGAACQTAGGADGTAFVAAASHCTNAAPCEYVTPYPCAATGGCSEPVCCGSACLTVNGCKDGAYAAATEIAGTTLNGCGAMLANAATGVLCCRNN